MGRTPKSCKPGKQILEGSSPGTSSLEHRAPVWAQTAPTWQRERASLIPTVPPFQYPFFTGSFLHPTNSALSLVPRRQILNHEFKISQFSGGNSLQHIHFPLGIHTLPNGIMMTGVWLLQLIPSDATIPSPPRRKHPRAFPLVSRD